jgi:hypothetical protein
MSSAFYSQGMNSYNNNLPQGGYKTWKGTGVFSNPIGSTASLIRPFTNKDLTNVFPTGFGLPRPIKHYRKGTVISDADTKGSATASSNSVRSSKSAGNMVSQLMDMPGGFSVKENRDLTKNNVHATKIVSDWYPIENLTEKPQPNSTNGQFCCNQERNARNRVLPTSTNLDKNYYQTNHMYLYNRCQTFEQREFNFVSGPIDKNLTNLLQQFPLLTEKIIAYAKPGSPLALNNLYVAQCVPNNSIEYNAEVSFMLSITNSMFQKGLITSETLTQLKDPINNINNLADLIIYLNSINETDAVAYLYHVASNPYVNMTPSALNKNSRGCKQVYYKPNNPQYAKQGSVSSSTRMLKLNVDTITKCAAKNQLQIDKAKTENGCNKAIYIGNPFFFQGQPQYKRLCSK